MTFNEEKPCTHDETGKNLDIFFEKIAKHHEMGKDLDFFVIFADFVDVQRTKMNLDGKNTTTMSNKKTKTIELKKNIF